MKTRAICLAAALALGGAAPALAHGDHGDEHHQAALDADSAKARASEEVTRLVSVKKVAASWRGATAKTAERKGTEWLVTFENAKAKENKILYVFLKSSGEFVAANFTGR